MTLISPTLAATPALVAIAIFAGRIVAAIAREVRITTVVWLALRSTRPEERAEIIRALTGKPQHGSANANAAQQLPAAGPTRRQTKMPTELRMQTKNRGR
jgi:hypothetical protein